MYIYFRVKAYRELNLVRALDEDIRVSTSLLLHWARQQFLEIPPFISDPWNLCLLCTLCTKSRTSIYTILDMIKVDIVTVKRDLIANIEQHINWFSLLHNTNQPGSNKEWLGDPLCIYTHYKTRCVFFRSTRYSTPNVIEMAFRFENCIHFKSVIMCIIIL